MKKPEPLFKTEAELCAAFIEWAKHYGWTAYAETEGWDIVLVNKDGVQIGIQAKLTFNVKVMNQVLPELWYGGVEGPDYRAILLGACLGACGGSAICTALGIGCFAPMSEYRVSPKQNQVNTTSFNPQLPDSDVMTHWNLNHNCGMTPSPWHYWNPTRRLTLPKYIPDVTAGASGPVQLTKWKVKALRIIAIAEIVGFVTRADFKEEGIDIRRWIGPLDAWLMPGSGPGEFVLWRATAHEQHPDVYKQVKTDVLREIEDRKARQKSLLQ